MVLMQETPKKTPVQTEVWMSVIHGGIISIWKLLEEDAEHGTLTGKEENHEEKTKFIIRFSGSVEISGDGVCKSR